MDGSGQGHRAALTTPREWGGHAMRGGSFLRVPSKHNTPVVGRGKSTEGENVLDNVYFLKLDIFIFNNLVYS